MYLLQNGEEVTAEQIKTAYVAGLAVLVHSYADGHTATDLLLEGKEWDNRGENHSVWDASWTTKPQTINKALAAAYCRP